MPIFISRFAPDRSLVGNFLSTRGRREKGTEPKKAPQQQDRLELSDRQTASPTAATTRANAPDTTSPVTATQAPETQNTGKTQSASSRTPANLSISETVQLRRTKIQNSESFAGSNASPTDTASSPLVLRLGQLLGGVKAVGSPDDEGSDGGDFLLSIQQENDSAATNATVERLGAFLTRLDALNEPDEAVSADETAAEGLANTPEVPVVAPEPADTELNPVVVPQAETVPREIQEQELQKDLQAISTGLQADAAIETRRNVGAAAQNAQRSGSRNQRQEVRENQTEIRSLQSDRRRMQQDVQKTDQAIRQIQSRNSQLQNSSTTSAGTGTSLDILAQ
jgi:hypothetical protein